MRWDTIVNKFETLSGPRTRPALQHKIEDLVTHIEDVRVSELARLLETVE